MFKHWKLLTDFSTWDGQQHLSWRLPNAACRWNPAKAIGKRLDTSTCAKRRNNGGGNHVEQRGWGRQRTRFLGFAWKMIDSKGEVMRKRARVILPKVHWNYSMLKNLKLVLTLDPQTNRNRRNTPSWCSQPCCDLHHMNLLQATKHDRLWTASFL